MKLQLICAALAGAFLALGPAHAETIDLATVKCSDFVAMDNETGSFVFTWLLGYQNGINGTTTLDVGAFETLGRAIGEYCGANPDVGVLSATTEVMAE